MQWGWNPDSFTAVATLLAAAALGAVVVFRWRKKDKAEAARHRIEDQQLNDKLRKEERESQQRIRQADLEMIERRRTQDLAAIRESKNERIASRIRVRCAILCEGALDAEKRVWGVEVVNSNDFPAQDLRVECLWNKEKKEIKLGELPPGRYFIASKPEQRRYPWALARLIEKADIWDVLTSPGYRVNLVEFSYGAERFERSVERVRVSPIAPLATKDEKA